MTAPKKKMRTMNGIQKTRKKKMKNMNMKKHQRMRKLSMNTRTKKKKRPMIAPKKKMRTVNGIQKTRKKKMKKMNMKKEQRMRKLSMNTRTKKRISNQIFKMETNWKMTNATRVNMTKVKKTTIRMTKMMSWRIAIQTQMTKSTQKNQKRGKKKAQVNDNKVRKTCDVHIQAAKILKAVVQEIGGSEQIYQDVSWYISLVGYEVQFYVPSKVGVDGMANVAICGMMPEGTTKEDACEEIARDALELLQHEHGINVLNHNSAETSQIRGRCVALVEKFNENKYIYDFIRSKSTMVVDGIGFASDIFINRAYETDNATEKIPAQENMSTVLRDCAKELREISKRSRDQLDNQDRLTKMLQHMSRNQLQSPYVEYSELHFKVGANKVISALTIVLEQAASKAGFRMPVVTTEELNGGYYIGKVELKQLPSG